MRHIITAGLMTLVATPALSGGIERSNQSMNILFQQGRYLEVGATYGAPKVSGNLNPLLGGTATGNIARNFLSGSVSFKADINDQLSYAVILDQPFGADTVYPVGSALGTASGTIKNTMLTGVMRYKFDGGFSAFAGIRASWTSGTVSLPLIPGLIPTAYTMSAGTDQAFGYLIGVAYEKPEIALRVALTYSSKIKHSFDATETGLGAPATIQSSFNTNIPQSLNLEFQSGVAADTLVFGSIRWVDWTDFNISPTRSPNLVAFQKDSITYTLGVGRKFSEAWSGSLSLSHDTGNGNPTSNLGPVGKRNSIGVGVSYTMDAVTISGGIQYSRLGSAQTTLGSAFGDNSAIGAGIRVGYRF